MDRITTISEIVVLYNNSGSSDKLWVATIFDTGVYVHWGKNTGDTELHNCKFYPTASLALAASFAEKLINEKLKRDYEIVGKDIDKKAGKLKPGDTIAMSMRWSKGEIRLQYEFDVLNKDRKEEVKEDIKPKLTLGPTEREWF